MIEMKVFSNIEEAIGLCMAMQKELAPEISKSLNRAVHGIKTDVSRAIVSRHGIKRSEVKDWTPKYANPNELEAEMTVAGKRLGLEKFVKSKLKRMEGGQNKGGVTIDYMGKSVHLPKAFTHDVHTGTMRVLRREKGARNLPRESTRNGKRLWGRFPLSRLTAKSVPQHADDDDIVDVAVSGAEARFLQQFDHLVGRLMEEHL